MQILAKGIMNRQRRAGIVVCAMMVQMIALFLFWKNGTVAYGAGAEAKTVKVGFFAMDGYHMIDENGIRSGYGYDFLQMATRYVSFEYEYIGYDKTWQEMQEMLEKGEIDMVTSMRKTKEREKKGRYPGLFHGDGADHGTASLFGERTGGIWRRFRSENREGGLL